MNNALFWGQFCDVAKSGNDLDKDVAKLGYKLNLKIEIFKHPFRNKIKIQASYILEPCNKKSSKIFLKFGQIPAIENLSIFLKKQANHTIDPKP